MQDHQPSVAVLMLAYNGGHDAIPAIQSLSHERALIDDIFINDNNSTDSTRKDLSERAHDLNFHHIKPNENKGFAGGFNDLFDAALTTSRADYFLILNNDTEADQNFITELLARAEPNKIVSPMILWHKDKSTVIQCAGEFDREMIKMNNFFAGKQVTEMSQDPFPIEQSDGCCFLIHRKWLEKGHRFNSDLFIYFEDVDFFFNLQKEGVSFEYVPKSVLYHKEYGTSGVREKPSAFRNYYFYRNRMFICQKLHSGIKKWRVYFRLISLAFEKFRSERKLCPKAAHAILSGILDFFTGKMGRQQIP